MTVNERRNITLEMATQAGCTPMGFHVSVFAPTEVCLGSDLFPRKMFFAESKLSGQCARCLSFFVFNVYTMEWMRITEEIAFQQNQTTQ